MAEVRALPWIYDTSGEFAKEINKSLTWDSAPQPKAKRVGPTGAARAHAARRTKWFRKFNRSSLRKWIKGSGLKEAGGLLAEGFEKGEPPPDFEHIASMIAAGGHGYAKTSSQAGQMLWAALLVEKNMKQVPDGLMLLGRKRAKVREVAVTEPVSPHVRSRRAEQHELGREIGELPTITYCDLWTRQALTELEWLDVEEDIKHLKVVFLVDSSGSMIGPPQALAVACAIKLGKVAQANGHEVWVRFYSDKVSPPVKPEAALALVAKGFGGGNDMTGLACQTADEEDKADAIVLVSDMQTQLYFTTDEHVQKAVNEAQRKHWDTEMDYFKALGYNPKAELHSISIGGVEHSYIKYLSRWWGVGLPVK